MPAEQPQVTTSEEALTNHIVDVNRPKILKLGEHKGFPIMIQIIGLVFQYIIFKDGNWYQAFFTDEDDKDRKEYTQFELVRATDFVFDAAVVTVRVLTGEKLEVDEKTGELLEIFDLAPEKEGEDGKPGSGN